MNFFENQVDISIQGLNKNIFLSGQAGTGKSTTALAFLSLLRNNQISGNRILVLVPQRSLGIAYQNFLDELGDFNGGVVTIQTLGGVAQRMIRLFWPVIAPMTSFSIVKKPIFLTLETAQYYLNNVCEPYFEKGYFESIRTEKPRILSQILDNLNKAAVIGFPQDEIGSRLKSAWSQEPNHIIAYDQAQEIASKFREFCFRNNFLDFSLQVEIFSRYLWSSFLCTEYLKGQYDFLIYENIEEDVPVFHDILLEWLPKFTGSLIIRDENAGFRSFLGADPISANRFEKKCDLIYQINNQINESYRMLSLKKHFLSAFQNYTVYDTKVDLQPELSVSFNSYYPEMIEKITHQILNLLNQGVMPGEIAILAPFVSDVLRFQIQNRFTNYGIEIASHRPSRSLREEPLTKVLLTWSKIAHPQWDMRPSSYELRFALMHSIQDLDPIRADLLVKLIFKPKSDFWISDVFQAKMEFLERITLSFCHKYQTIMEWLKNTKNDNSDLDIFISRLFGEILSQPGFGLNENYSAAEITSRLIESIQKFRKVVSSSNEFDSNLISKEYITTINKGIIAALNLESWEPTNEKAIYVSPAYTFLMQNRSVKYQFWLDIGSMGWWQRLMQPLTQPYVLSRNWKNGEKWTDLNEFEINQANLSKLVQGLLNRCSEGLFVHSTGYNESGNEEKGPLLKTIQKILRNSKKPMEINDV